MGTITSRKRRDGTVGHTAQIRLKRGGKVIHTEAKTLIADQRQRRGSRSARVNWRSPARSTA